MSSDLSGEALAKSEALAKEDCSFGGLLRTAGATVARPWGSTSWEIIKWKTFCRENAPPLTLTLSPQSGGEGMIFMREGDKINVS